MSTPRFDPAARCAIAIAVITATAQGAAAEPEGAERPEDVAATVSVDAADDPRRDIAAIEVALTLAIATVRYQFDGARKENWDLTSIEQRFTREAWRYDNNPFGINYFAHSLEGTVFHLIGRANNLGLSESAALGFASSFAWEFLFEFRERVSVNDVIFTPGSGVAIGEFFHWLGEYVDSAPADAGFGQTVARYTVGLVTSVHRELQGGELLEVDERDELGLRADIWHRFDVAALAESPRANMEAPDLLWSARIGARLAVIDGYRRPGAIAESFADGNFTEARLEMTRGPSADGTRFWAETVLLGHYRQDIDSRPRRGRAWLLGAAISYDYRREQLGDWRERLALLHLPGLAAEGELHGGPFTLRTGARLHADFGSLEAIAHQQWMAENPDEVGKTILRKQGYYFGWGGSLRLFAELETDWPLAASAGASLLTGRYDSDENLDRNQEALTADVDIDDGITELESWLRVRPLERGPHLELRLLHQRHDTDHAGIEASQSMTRVSAGVGYVF